MIVTTGEDGTCRLWSSDGRELRTMRAHEGRNAWALAVRYAHEGVEGFEECAKMVKYSGETPAAPGPILPVAVGTGGADCVVKTWHLQNLWTRRELREKSGVPPSSFSFSRASRVFSLFLFSFRLFFCRLFSSRLFSSHLIFFPSLLCSPRPRHHFKQVSRHSPSSPTGLLRAACLRRSKGYARWPSPSTASLSSARTFFCSSKASTIGEVTGRTTRSYMRPRQTRRVASLRALL